VKKIPAADAFDVAHHGREADSKARKKSRWPSQTGAIRFHLGKCRAKNSGQRLPLQTAMNTSRFAQRMRESRLFLAIHHLVKCKSLEYSQRLSPPVADTFSVQPLEAG